KTLAEKLYEGLTFLTQLSDPKTPPHERRELYKRSPWFGALIERCYRHEYQKAKQAGAETHRGASRLAEENVAAAAGISASSVHQLCHRVRKDRGEDEPEPPMTAAQLAHHLERGPDLKKRPARR